MYILTYSITSCNDKEFGCEMEEFAYFRLTMSAIWASSEDASNVSSHSVVPRQ